MTYKTALERAIAATDSAPLVKNIKSMRSLFVPLWSAIATDGVSIRQRLEIDAIGGLVKTSNSTILNMSELKNSSPGDENGNSKLLDELFCGLLVTVFL